MAFLSGESESPVAPNFEYAHGEYYGDYSGVNFYGPPTEGFWLDCLPISSRYIDPLFNAICDLAWSRVPAGIPSRIVADWIQGAGWANSPNPTELLSLDVVQLSMELSQLRLPDLESKCHGSTAQECLQCSLVIQRFVSERLELGKQVYLEAD
jgi:hypothetical protein